MVLRRVWLTSIDLIIVVPVERVRSAKAIKARLSLHSNLHEGIIVLSIGLLLCDHVRIIVRVVVLRCVWLASVDLIIVIPVERVRSAKPIEARLPLHTNLHE